MSPYYPSLKVKLYLMVSEKHTYASVQHDKDLAVALATSIILAADAIAVIAVTAVTAVTDATAGTDATAVTDATAGTEATIACLCSIRSCIGYVDSRIDVGASVSQLVVHLAEGQEAPLHNTGEAFLHRRRALTYLAGKHVKCDRADVPPLAKLTSISRQLLSLRYLQSHLNAPSGHTQLRRHCEILSAHVCSRIGIVNNDRFAACEVFARGLQTLLLRLECILVHPSIAQRSES